ncbi:unnamed protein product [Orchesella dallaii]|uniref:Uncharacterized protein n=1 Tax=Orchesella dallaii TaxID=48710 RepID=A0ABP1Q1M8_9HEXA
MQKTESIQTLFEEIQQTWHMIPKSQIWEPQRFLGSVIFERQLHTDVMMPGMDDLVWDTAADLLDLSNDHLMNSLLAVKYVVERARQAWLGSTDPDPNVKWWGEGHNHHKSIRNLLFDFQQPYIVAARFLEEKDAARQQDGGWEKFLGRVPSNYILFPLALFNEPHTSESLWLESGGITFKIIRSFFSMIQNTRQTGKYSTTSWMNAIDIVGKNSSYKQDDYKCSSFDSIDPFKNRTASFDYRLKSSTLEWFSWWNDDDFMNTLAVKLTLKHFREEKKALLNSPFGWNLDEHARDRRFHRFLPGELLKYSEEQLLLMAIIRHAEAEKMSYHLARTGGVSYDKLSSDTILKTLPLVEGEIRNKSLPKDGDSNEDGYSILSLKDETSDPITASRRRRKKKRRGNARRTNKFGSKSSSRSSLTSNKPMPLEWYNFRLSDGYITFKMWWQRSKFWTRMNVIIVAILFVLALINGIVGIICVLSAFTTPSNMNPYVCTTNECRNAAKWMTQTMDTNVDPCENFYEFVCGNTEELGIEVDFFSEYINVPLYKIEFGENSILAKILRNYNETHEDNNQPVKYYQACLNDRARPQYGLTAFVNTIQNVFDTKDLNTFESSPLQLEEVGARMFHVMGHGVYLNMAFYSYPYIQRWLPVLWIIVLRFDEKTTRLIFENLMPLLGVRNPGIVEELVLGVQVMMTVVYKISVTFFDHPPSEFPKEVKASLKGLCPPMGVNLNIQKIFELFIGESFRWTFDNPKTEAYSLALQDCFDVAPSQFTKHKLTHPKTALAGVWIFGLFFDFFRQMRVDLWNTWGLNRSTALVNLMLPNRDYNSEHGCLNEMTHNLAYLPILRYMQASLDDPVEFSFKKTEEIQALLKEVQQHWLQIPETEVWEQERFIGKAILERGLHADVVMPVLDELSLWDLDSLDLTDDHLHNSLVAVKYTVEKAKQNWLGSSDPDAQVRWWGDGYDGVSIRYKLFSFVGAFVLSARFLEREGAARRGEYEQFLGRNLPNYILFPYSLYNEPHTSETLWLESGGITFKMMRTFMSLIQSVFYFGKYGPSKWITPADIIGNDSSYNQDNYNCSSLDYDFNGPNSAKLYDYKPNKSNMKKFSWEMNHQFMNSLAVKLALKNFRKRRRAVLEVPFGWHLDKEMRNKRMRRFLPGMLSKYSEDQLFFMSLVRYNCKGSWKKFKKSKNLRYVLEITVLNMLMQSEEFSHVWKCPSNSFMNLEGKRCLKWMP